MNATLTALAALVILIAFVAFHLTHGLTVLTGIILWMTLYSTLLTTVHILLPRYLDSAAEVETKRLMNRMVK